MKRILWILMLCFPILVQAQSSSMNVQQEFIFENDSEESEIYIDIMPDTWTLSFGLVGIVNKGSLSVVLYDPSGKKQGGFGLKSQNTRRENSLKNDQVTYSFKSKSAMGAKGTMEKSFAKPAVGKWTVKIIPDGVDGHLAVHVMHHQMDKEE